MYMTTIINTKMNIIGVWFLNKVLFLILQEENEGCIPICPFSFISCPLICLFSNMPVRIKIFLNWMIKMVSMDSSVHPDSNDVKILPNISNLWSSIKCSSFQGIKLNICLTILIFANEIW